MNSAVRMMAAANATSTSSTLLSPGGFALRCLPTAVATSCRSWGSATRRLRSTGGLAETLSRRFRSKWPRSLTGADTMLWSEIGRKEGWGCTVTFRTSLRSRCLVRMQSMRFLPRPLKVCDTPVLGVLKNVFTIARSWLLAKDSSTVIMRASAPGCDRFLNHAVLAFFSHPGAITPMGVITPIPVRKHN